MSTKIDTNDERVLGHLTRQTEGLAITEFVQEHIGHSIVVYGKTDVGKSSMVRNEVIFALKERLPNVPVHYGNYVLGKGQNIELADSRTPIWDTVESGGVFFVDEFDTILSDTYENQRQFLADLALACEVSKKPITLVFMINEDQLAELNSVLNQIPNWNHEMLPIHGIDVASALVEATSTAANRDVVFEAGLADKIAKDAADAVPSKRLGISPRLVAILGVQIASTLEKPEQTEFTNADYELLGKHNGILWDFLWSRLSAAADIGTTTLATLYAHVRELSDAGAVKGLDNFEDLQLRYDLEPQESEIALEILENSVGVVRKYSDGRWRLVPSLLHQVVSIRTRRGRNEIAHAEEDLRGGMSNWKRYGIPLPKELLNKIVAHRAELHLDPDEVEFILDWVLRANSLPLDEARYWLRRLKDPEIKADVLRGALVDSDPDSRRRTAQILGEHECGIDVAVHLYDLALRDPAHDVREVAVNCLKSMDLASIRDRMLSNAKNHTRYRLNAIRALGALADSDAITVLTSIGKGNENNEPMDNRKIAIEALGGIDSDDARNALLSIGMQDPDQDVREVAAERLSKQVNDKTAPNLLARLMSWKNLEYSDDDSAVPASRAISNTIRAVLVVVGNLVPGILLIAIGHRKTGAAFIVVNVIAIAAAFFGGTLFFEPFIGFWILSIVVTVFYSTRILISDPKNANLPAGDFKWILRLIVFVLLTAVAAILDFRFVVDEMYITGAYVFALHGFAHILAKRYKTGFLILFIQALSFGYLLVSQFQDGIIYYDNLSLFGQSSIWWNAYLSAASFYLWMFVFFGTLAWDLGGVFFGHVILSRHTNVESRRRYLIRNFLCEGPFVSYCLRALTSEDPTAAKRAARSLHRYGSLIDRPILILDEANEIEPYPKKTVIDLLSRVRSNQALAEMELLLKGADARRRELTVAALSRHPTSRSLDILRSHKNELGPAQQRRNKRRFFFNRLGALQHQLGNTSFLVIIALPLVTFFLYEHSRTYTNPNRPNEKLIMRNCDEEMKTRIAIVDYMSHAATSAARKQMETIYHHGCINNDGSSELLMKISLISALAEIAPNYRDDTTVWRVLPKNAITVLLVGLTDEARLDVRVRTVEVLHDLSAQYGFLEQTTPEILATFVSRLSPTLTTTELEEIEREWIIDFFQNIATTNELQDHVSDQLKNFVLKPLEFSPLDQDQPKVQIQLSFGNPATSLRKYAVNALAAIGSSSSQDALQELVESKSLHVDVRQFASEKLADVVFEPRLNPNDLDESNWEATITAGEAMAVQFTNQNEEIPAELHRKLGAAYYLSEESLGTGEYLDEAIENLEQYYEQMNESSDNADARALLHLANSYVQKSSHISNKFMTGDGVGFAYSIAAKTTTEPFLSSLRELSDGEVTTTGSNSSYATWEVDSVILNAYCLQAIANINTSDPAAIDDAERLINKALEYNSIESPYPYYLMGYKHWLTDNNVDAIAYLREALLIDDNYVAVYDLLNYISEDDTYTEAVVELLEQHVESSSVSLTNTLSYLYHDRLAPSRQSLADAVKDFKKARDFANKAVNLPGSGMDTSLQASLVESLLTAGDSEDTISDGKELLKTNLLDPVNTVMVNFFVLSGQYHQLAEQTDRAANKDLVNNIRLQLSSLKDAFSNLPDDAESAWNTDGTRYYIENCAKLSTCSMEPTASTALFELLEGIEKRSQDDFDAALSKLGTPR